LAPQPEQQARSNIDRLLEAAGWHVCDASAANIHAALTLVVHLPQARVIGRRLQRLLISA
jgi:hypothetical protein